MTTFVPLDHGPVTDHDPVLSVDRPGFCIQCDRAVCVYGYPERTDGPLVHLSDAKARDAAAASVGGSCQNGSAPAGATNTPRGLTRSSESSREGLAVDATQTPSDTDNRAQQIEALALVLRRIGFDETEDNPYAVADAATALLDGPVAAMIAQAERAAAARGWDEGWSAHPNARMVGDNRPRDNPYRADRIEAGQ